MAQIPVPRFASLLLMVLLATPVFAQDPPPPQVPEPRQQQEEEEPFGDVITVTAQKRAEDIQDVPVAVTAMPEQQVDALTAGGADIKAISGRVPSLLIESSFGRAFPRFYIRGLGNTDFDFECLAAGVDGL